VTPPDRLPRGGRGEALPRLLVAVDGRTFAELPPTLAAAAFLRDLDLAGLVAVAERGAPFAVDLNSVDGLSADGAAVRFVVAELGIPVVASRRPSVAEEAIRWGGRGLVHVFAFDSTGVARALEAHPRLAGAGTLVSPGLVVRHMTAEELAALPRPLVAYGLVEGATAARRLLELVDAVVVAPAVAVALGGAFRSGTSPA
jgi:glycerol-3-phosphate responsive antiterminator